MCGRTNGSNKFVITAQISASEYFLYFAENPCASAAEGAHFLLELKQSVTLTGK